MEKAIDTYLKIDRCDILKGALWLTLKEEKEKNNY